MTDLESRAATAEAQPGVPAASSQPIEMNTFAIVSFVTAFVFAPLGIIFGHISLSQIKKRPQKGRGLALSGTIVGYVLTALGIAYLVMVLVLTSLIVAQTATQGDDCIKVTAAETSLNDSWSTSVSNADLTKPDQQKAASTAFDEAIAKFTSDTQGLKDPDVKAAVKDLRSKVLIYADALNAPSTSPDGSDNPTWNDTLNTASDNWDTASSNLGTICQWYR